MTPDKAKRLYEQAQQKVQSQGAVPVYSGSAADAKARLGTSLEMNTKPVMKMDIAQPPPQPSFNNTMQVTVAPPKHLMNQPLIG